MMLLHLDPPIEGGVPSSRPECANPYDLAPEATVSREEIDRYFDHDMARSQRDGFLNALRTDAAAAREVALTRDVLARLDEPVIAPDLTSAVLRRVGRTRGFLGSRQRRLVTAGRVSVLGAALLTFAMVLFARERNPELDLTSSAPMPVSRVVEAGRSGLAEFAMPPASSRGERRLARVAPRTPDAVGVPFNLRWSVEPGSVMRASYAPDAVALTVECTLASFEGAPLDRCPEDVRSAWFMVVDGVPTSAADLSRGQWRGTMWINTIPTPRIESDVCLDR